MNAVSNAFRIIGSLIFIGWLGYELFGFSQQYEGNEKELGPTMLGLSAFLIIGILGIFVSISRDLARASLSASHREEMKKMSNHEAQSNINADAIMERYLAERNTQSYADTDASSALPTPSRPAFGRKTG